MTKLMSEAIKLVATLPADRQDEIAKMLIDMTESDRSDLRLSPDQLAEVDAALAEDGPYVSDEDMEAFFRQYRT